jgi:hypothetical protein
MIATEKQRIPLAEADALVAEVLELLRPATEQIAVAGSIRRRRPEVGDIEIVAIPRFDETQEPADLFGTMVTRSVNALDALCARLLVDGTFHGRLDKNGRQAIGSKYKRLLFRGFGLDLFCGTPENWGVLLAIRTGPATFAHAFVTNVGHMTRPAYAGAEHKPRPGLLPRGMRVGEGNQLWGPDGRLIETPTEAAFFEAIQQPCLDPWRRR